MSNLIDRQAVIDLWEKYHPAIAVDAMQYDAELRQLPSAPPTQLTDDDIETIRIHLSAIKENLCNQHRWNEAKEYEALIDRLTVQPEPCEDAVSRKDCLKALSNMMDTDGFRNGWAVSRANVECMLKSMPPVTPKQRTGHWHITDAYPHNVYCSECHKRFAQTHWSVWEDGSLPRNFCPNCGAKMEEGAE